MMNVDMFLHTRTFFLSITHSLKIKLSSWDDETFRGQLSTFGSSFQAGRPGIVFSCFWLLLLLLILPQSPRVPKETCSFCAFYWWRFFTNWRSSGSGNKSGVGSTVCWQYMIPLYNYHLCSALVWGWYILHPWNLKWTPDTQNCSVFFFLRRYLLPSQCMFGINILFPVVLRPVRQKHRSKNPLVSLLVCVHTTWEENMNIGGTQWHSKWFGSPDYRISPSNSKWNIIRYMKHPRKR